MIKIAFVIDTIESPTAGTEKQLLMLIKHLDRRRFEPYLCVLRLSEWLKNDFCDCELVDVGVASFARPSSYLNILNFVSFLKNRKIDIVQTHFVEGNKIGVLAGKLANVRAIISTRRNQGYWHNAREIMILKALNRWVTRFLANSENTRQWVINTEVVDPARINVIHNSLEIDSYRRGTAPERLRFRQELNLPDHALVVGIVANLRPVKAIDMFLMAARAVKNECPMVSFVVVGDGPEKPDLEELCSRLGISSSVRFLGKRTDIPEILSCIDIGVLSSSSESFSNSIVEYMAASLPVVCTDVGGAREAVEEGMNGFVVSSGDHEGMAEKLHSIITSESLTEFGKVSRLKAEKQFSLSAIMNQYECFYDGVMK